MNTESLRLPRLKKTHNSVAPAPSAILLRDKSHAALRRDPLKFHFL